MTASTTLMTFRVRTPISARSVDLYGSWDNFTAPYQMQHDPRLGAQHWTGCHNFENIICDGRTEGLSGPRRGGLKMGGTYWYFYKLNNDIEFHNSAEPATAACPMMPGQLVNILQVPIALSGARKRDNSVGSTSSEPRTLNPEDRFMNPRPVPTPPKLVRMETSPAAAQTSSYSTSTSPTTSQPSLSRCASKDNLRVPNMHRLPRMASHDALQCSGNTPNKAAGLRQAFKALRNGRSPSPGTRYKHIVDWKPLRDGHISISAPQTPELESEANSYFELELPDPTPASRGLLLRTSSDTSIPTTSFLEHRRERSRSRSRGPSTLRGSFSQDEKSQLELERSLAQINGLDTLVEVASPQYTPVHPLLSVNDQACDDTLTPIAIEKRLPTLPNTPSSAYPPSTAGLSSNAQEGLYSRFSTSTIDTEYRVHSILVTDTSRFSEWSTDSDLMSPTSDSTIEDTLSSPEADLIDFAPIIRPITSQSPDLEGVCSPDDTKPTTHLPSKGTYATSSPNLAVRPLVQRKRSQTFHTNSDFQHYQLPETEYSSRTTLKAAEYHTHNSNEQLSSSIQARGRAQSHPARDRRSSVPHSESMQQLMEELSYLGNVISQN